MTRLAREALRGRAQTVLGPVEPPALGPTLMHEHLIWDIRTPAMRADPDQGPEITLCNCFAINYGRKRKAPGNLRFRCEPTALAEPAALRAAGGRTMVELTCGGLDPDPAALARLAAESGLHIVMGCGHSVHEYQDPANKTRDAEDFAQEMIDGVQVGPGAPRCAPASSARSAARRPGRRRSGASCAAPCWRWRRRGLR